MKKKYREIEVEGGTTIESAIEKLKKHDDLVCLKFNEKILYSDIDDVESAYLKIIGISKSEFDEKKRKGREEYENEKRNHEKAIPELTKDWIQKGTEILDKKYHELWSKCVPVRLGDLYKVMELECTLDIVKELNDGCDLEKSKEIIEEQGHSGISFRLVCSMVKSFCDRGNEFVAFVK